MGRVIATWAVGLSSSALGCGLVPDDLWQIRHEPHAQPQPAPVDPRIDRDCLDEQLTPFVEAIGAGWPLSYRPTGMVYVSAAGRALYAQSFGARDLEQGLPNTANTSFRVGSISKSFTAVGILQLAEAGQLTVQDTLGELLPEYPAVGAGITLHQLLSHTSGLFNYTDDAELMARRDQPMTPSELLATFWERPLEFEPGTRYRYSNSGYAVLGAVIERVTGQTYAEYMQESIFDPAGLERTTVGDAEGWTNRANGYTPDALGDLAPAFPLTMTIPFAAGAIRSTAVDLVRWHSALGTDLLLDAQSREQLITPVLDGYAYGWSVSEHDDLQVVRHGGGIDGFLSDLVRVPELDLAVVVLLNSEGVAPQTISDAALGCALGEDIPAAPPPPIVELDASQQQRLFGTYEITEETRQVLASLGLDEAGIASLASAEIYSDAGRLLLEPIGQDATRLLPLSPFEFVVTIPDTTLTFSFADGEGQPATSFVIDLGGVALVFER
jgi:CubicO group peptidase (beta-lactamase class C family)